MSKKLKPLADASRRLAKPFQRGSLGSARLLPRSHTGGSKGNRSMFPPALLRYGNPIKQNRDKDLIGLAVHAENLGCFLPRILVRDYQVSWTMVVERTIIALTLMEFICRGDPDFGELDYGFTRFLEEHRFGDKDWVQDYVFATNSGRGAKYLVEVWPQGEKKPRLVKRPRWLPKIPDYANGFVPDKKSAEFLRFKKKWANFAVPRMLGMGPMNPDWMRGAPGQHWLGKYPDIWDRVFLPLDPSGNGERAKRVRAPINMGGYPNYFRRYWRYRSRKWWGMWLPRTEWKIPAWA